MLYNGFGVAIVKNASGVQSTTIDISRTSLVWLFFLTIPITIQLPNQGFLVIRESFNLLKLCGFLLIVTGMLYYNQIFKMPYIFEKYVTRPKERLKKLKEPLL
jgi:drug/metabolite transporter (DMT)-like permease